MNIIEILLVIFSFLLFLFYLRWRIVCGWTRSLLFSLALIPALVLSTGELTQFLTVDEQYMILEPVSLKTSPMASWNLASFRTTDAVVGSVVHVFRILTDWKLVVYWMLAKAIHWLFGLLLLLMIFDYLAMRFVPKEERVIFWAIFFGITLPLPVVLIAFKVINYDLVSMLLMCLSAMVLWGGVAGKSERSLIAALALATLAVQEKLVASPILLAVIAVYTLWVFEINKHDCAGYLLRCARRYSIAILTMGVTSFALLFVVVVNRYGALPQPEHRWATLFTPLITWVWPLLRIVGGDRLVVDFFKPDDWHLGVVELGSLVVLAMVLLIVALVLHMPFVRGILFWVRSSFQKGIMRFAAPVLILLNIICGVTATFFLHGHGMLNSALTGLAGYHPTTSFNGMVTVFGASSLFEHLLLGSCWACAVFMNALPMAILTAIVVTIILSAWKKSTNLPGTPFDDSLVIATLLIPWLYGISQTPSGGRYLGPFIVLLVLVSALRLSAVLSRISTRIRWSLVVLLYISVLVEVAPFGPVFGPFRPIWSPPDLSSATEGRLNPTWVGWGEEVMIAGKRIERKFKGTAEEGENRFWFNYQGAWLRPDTAISGLLTFGKDIAIKYTKKDYFVITRAGIGGGIGQIPPTQMASDSIAFRGFTQAWIYRGDILKENGFVFRP